MDVYEQTSWRLFAFNDRLKEFLRKNSALWQMYIRTKIHRRRVLFRTGQTACAAENCPTPTALPSGGKVGKDRFQEV